MIVLSLMKMAESSPKKKKTVQAKEKLLVMNNFSFSHNVFKRLELPTYKNQRFFGKELKSTLLEKTDWHEHNMVYLQVGFLNIYVYLRNSVIFLSCVFCFFAGFSLSSDVFLFLDVSPLPMNDKNIRTVL